MPREGVIEMLGMIRFRACATHTPDGLVHVQNCIGPFLGQHHVHTLASFKEWAKGCPGELTEAQGECGCGLGPGWVREYDGHTWHNPAFGGPGPGREVTE